jgi:hypothetical protein
VSFFLFLIIKAIVSAALCAWILPAANKKRTPNRTEELKRLGDDPFMFVTISGE